MSINIKKYTKDQMAKMVEETEEKFKSKRDEYHELAEQLKSRKKEIVELKSDLVKKNQTISSLKAENAALGDRIDKQNDALSEYANRNMNLKADISALRVKLTDTETALGRANAEITYSVTEKNELNAKIKQLDGERHYYKSRSEELDHYKRLLVNANEDLAFKGEALNVMREKRYNAEQRANYAEAHQWRNLWAWVKRKLGGERDEHVS